jgi:hypothetical protein
LIFSGRFSTCAGAAETKERNAIAVMAKIAKRISVIEVGEDQMNVIRVKRRISEEVYL